MSEYPKNLGNGWEVTVAKTVEQVEKLRQNWHQLQSREPYPAPNADIDRYISVLKSQDARMRPYVILFSHFGISETMVIARLEKLKMECKIGYKVMWKPSVCCLTIVYGGILGQRDTGNCTLVLRQLLSALRQREADMVFFNQLRTDSPIYQAARTMPTSWCRGYFPQILPHWTMSVPENIDEFYQSRSKKHRGNLKRYIKKLEKEYPNQIRIVTYTEEDDLDDAIKAASQVSHSTYQRGLGCGFTDNQRTRVLLTTAARQGWLRASVLYVDDKPCAFQFMLAYGRICFLDQIGFDPAWGEYNVGTVLFLRVLETLCADLDIDYMDFYFGDADYKRSYGDKQWQEATVHIFAPRLHPILINMITSLIRGLSLGLAYVAQKLGFTNKIKRRWRDKLQQKNKRI